MIYIADITTPANTLQDSPKKTVLQVTKGLVYKLEIAFPPGSRGLLSCYINDGNYQVWPVGYGSVFRGDNSKIVFDDTYLKLLPPYQFSIFTYNLDELYEHNLIFRLGLVSQEIFMARFLPTYTYDHFIRLLEAMNKRQLEAQTTIDQEILSNPFGFMSEEEDV